jgi:hypothetical protein
MTETLNPCTKCKACWLATDLTAIGTGFDNGTLTRSEANDKISRASQKAGLAGCPGDKIVAGRKLLVRVNPNLGQSRAYVTTPSTSVADVYEIDRGRVVHDNQDHMRGFKRGRRTLGRRG